MVLNPVFVYDAERVSSPFVPRAGARPCRVRVRPSVQQGGPGPAPSHAFPGVGDSWRVGDLSLCT